MTIIPVNGKNERMGGLFSTPKHLLLVDGVPAITRTVDYMKQFGEVVILANEDRYFSELSSMFPGITFPAQDTDNVIETIKQHEVKGDLWIVDCDVVPQNLNIPFFDCVYLFENKSKLPHYSNFFLKDGKVVDCNEKLFMYPHAGAGVYYFKDAKRFLQYSGGFTNVSQVIGSLVLNGHEIWGDTTSTILRFGTLPDITGGFTTNKLERTITKRGDKVLNEVAWYNAYEDKKDIPKVLSYHPSAMTMEFIEADGMLNIYDVVDLIEKYRKYRPMNTLDFEFYIDRIEAHLERNHEINNGGRLIEKLKKVRIYPTFAHGDLSVTNIIQTKSGPKLIDPLYCDNMFGSYILDYAKLLFSLKFYAYDLGNYNLLMSMGGAHEDMIVLMASECVRVATYKKEFSFIAENLIQEL